MKLIFNFFSGGFIREDKVEDLFLKMKEVDHYELELHQFQMDRQKELLCTGKTFRVSPKMKTFFVRLKLLNLLFYF